MCGIVGFINKKDKAQIEVIEEMESVIKHRGPDDKGSVVSKFFSKDFEDCAIGFVRLSIRELTMNGHQPMWNKNKDIVLTFNGEIYNSDLFRDELESKGYEFRGTSDTEVLLYLYEEYGMDEMLTKIDGMFAFCILDYNKHTIYLVRDRIGEKPLYIYQNDEVFLWGSEYKSFYCHKSFEARLNEDVLSEYIMFRYISDNETLLKGVKNVTPGHYLKLTEKGIEDIEYWKLENCRRFNDCSKKECKDRLSEWLDKAVESRLVSDLEVGVQLSGGVDSSHITYLASKKTTHKIKTFGIVFDGKKYSEKRYMDKVDEICEIEPYQYNFESNIFFDSWINSTYYFEAPMNHEGTLGLYYLNKRAKEKVTVMLCGEGADETLGGYRRFYKYALYKKKPWIKYRNILKRGIKEHNLLGVYQDEKNVDVAFIKDTQFTNNKTVKHILNNNNVEDIISKRYRIFKETNGTGIRKLMNYEVQTYLQDLLMRADKISMASSMELRVPFLMPKLVEFEGTIPDEFLVDATSNDPMRNTKMLLKELSSEVFGEAFAYRPKQGFGIPLMDYFVQEPMYSFINKKVLPGIERRGIFNYHQLKKWWEEELERYKREEKHSNNSVVQALWTAFSFEIWADMFIDHTPLAFSMDKYIVSRNEN